MKTHVWGKVANGKLWELARENRKHPTEAEGIVWEYLRRHFQGQKFRRQQIIGDYIVDFICVEKNVVIEIDGGYHNLPYQAEYDEQRTEYLNRIGLTVLRLTNEEVLGNIDDVMSKIKNYIIKELYPEI